MNKTYKQMLEKAEKWINEVKERETDVELDMVLGSASVLLHLVNTGRTKEIDKMSEDCGRLFDNRLELFRKTGI